MANYTGIQGQNILIVDTDPANPTEGQIWYNTTSNLLKGYANVVTNAWASGGNLNSGRTTLAGAGTQTAALGFGGFAPGLSAASESYNGTSWTTTPSLNTARRIIMGTGLQTAALAFGGLGAPGTSTPLTATELWNGSTWTNNPTGLPVGRHGGGTAGTQTATLVFGGSPYINTTASFDGSTWTAVPGTLNTGRQSLGGAGTQTAALAFGGNIPGNRTAATELWNGSSWTTVNSLNTARGGLGGAGTQTAAIGFGGYSTANTGATELWNGSTWATSPGIMATARYSLASATSGTQTAALGFGGYVGGSPYSNATEAWTGTAVAVRTITTS